MTHATPSRTSARRRASWRAFILGLGALGLLVVAPERVHAEDPPAGGPADKLKEQMQKIIELMKENERALIELSAGGKDRTTKPEIDCPILR